MSTETVLIAETVLGVQNAPGVRTEFSGEPVFNVNLSALLVDTAFRAAIPGAPGLSPYEEWLSRGNEGDYEDFLAAIAGPPGANGSTLPPVSFSFGDASPMVIHVTAEQRLMTVVQVVLRAAFDGEGSALRLRTAAGLVLLEVDQIAPGVTGTYETTPGALLNAGTTILLEITPGAGATAGNGFVVLNLN